MLTDTYLLCFLHNHNPIILKRCMINSSSDCKAINGTTNSDSLWLARWDLLSTSQAQVGSPRATWLEEYQEDATWTSDPWILVCVSSQMATVHPPKDGLCGQ